MVMLWMPQPVAPGIARGSARPGPATAGDSANGFGPCGDFIQWPKQGLRGHDADRAAAGLHLDQASMVIWRMQVAGRAAEARLQRMVLFAARAQGVA